jgi:hypothetical protein
MELIRAQKEAGLMDSRTRLQGSTDGKSSVVVADDRRSNPNLSDTDISKDLSSRSQKLAAVPQEDFESEIGESGVAV